MREWLYGRNPIYETLAAGRRHVFRLWVARGAKEKGVLTKIISMCRDQDITIEYVPRENLDTINPWNQAVALEVSGYPYRSLDKILANAQELSELPFLLILDSLQDPQNLGTLLRTAEIVGVHGILLPLRKTAKISPSVVSSSSGASEHLLITQCNLSQALRTLKENDIWVVGLEGSSDAQPPGQIDLGGSIAVVLGSEGKGMRPLVRQSCDLLLRLPMRGRIESLNAAAAGSVALYLVWQARGFS